MCTTHYTRWSVHGDPTSGVSVTDPTTRLLDKVEIDPVAGCWLWTAAKNNGGYGMFTFTTGWRRSAHRVSYETFVGPIPDGLQLDHLCRVRHCVNPDHLEPVTAAENTRRSPIHVSKTRRRHALVGTVTA